MVRPKYMGCYYNEEKVIQVDKSSMDRLLRRGEEILGFSHQNHQYNFSFIPEELWAITMYDNLACINVENNQFTISEQEYEAVLFHEGIHYLMHKKGLLFGPNTHRATLYDRLVDETVAELVTSQVYGYNELPRLQEQLYEEIQSRSAKEIIDQAKRGLPKEFSNATPLQALAHIEIEKRHREIERNYVNIRDLDAIKDDVTSFYEFLHSLSSWSIERHLRWAIRRLAIRNAQAITKNGVIVKDLVLWIDEAVDNKWDSYKIYFVGIVDPTAESSRGLSVK